MMAGEMREPENRTENRAENRWETIKAIWAKDEHRWLYVLVGITAGFLLGFTIESFVQSMDTPGWREALASLFPEAFGITVTVLVLNGLAERRVRLEMKRDLIFRMGSRQPDVAVHAAEHLWQHGWLQNGSLQGQYFAKANLYKAELTRANLQETSLLEANLEGANLAFANLIGANLSFAKLQGAVLMDAKLQGADLSWSNLEGANLALARLQGANLEDAKLQGVEYLLGATLDEWTMLPDGSHYDPALGPEQLSRFTDPEHPDFWQPKWVEHEDSETARLKADLIRRMGHKRNSVAIPAVDELAAHEWLYDGTLKNAYLVGANLQGANLHEANLQKAHLGFANLERTGLACTKLQGANLEYANLEGADLEGATFDENTMLPDGKNYDPELGPEQLMRFTDPDHPAFWESNSKSGDSETARLKANLIRRMGHKRSSVVIPAVEKLAAHGWLYDGTLKAAYLFGANLRGARLFGADLRKVRLWGAKLQRANLWNADLQGASLVETNLQWADLRDASLQGAILVKTDLRDASLQGANLRDASLQGATLQNATFDEQTVLPDGATWTPDTDMRRFTDPEHPDFWPPDWVTDEGG